MLVPRSGMFEEATMQGQNKTQNRSKAGTLRAAAYLRESTEEQGQGFSPQTQRQAIAEFAADNDMKLVGEYCDFHSGWRTSEGRPEFQRLMADAADGKFNVVLVFHTSRFARSQLEARRYKQLLRERLGIRVISATHLLGTLPWGYTRDKETGVAVPVPAQARVVLELFKRYARGEESDRSLAAWLNAQGALSNRGREFRSDTVREMLCNTAYTGYVSSRRSQDRTIRGLHDPLVSEELFDRVQEVRAYRAHVTRPSRASDEYLLRKLLCCARCGGRMQGTTGSRPPVRRYQCATRRHGGYCDQPITKAQPLEDQLVDWLQQIQPAPEMRKRLLAAMDDATQQSADQVRRRELIDQLDRLKDIYVFGDLTKAQYTMRRQTIQADLELLDPTLDPAIAQAEQVLSNFSEFWELETSPRERHRFLLSLFEQVFVDGKEILAVKPRGRLACYFQAATELSANPVKVRRD
jgi:hypothetical protein